MDIIPIVLRSALGRDRRGPRRILTLGEAIMSTRFTASRLNRRCTGLAEQPSHRFPSVIRLIAALALASAVLPVLGSVASAQDVTISLKLSYRCGSTLAAPGC